MDHLAAAARALCDTPDRAVALEHLLAAWREHHRHPDLAELFERLAAETTRAIEPVDPTLADADFHTAWIARASRARLVEIDVLLPGLFRGPLGNKIRQRFDLIVPFADDPRVTAAFGRMIDNPPVMAASNFSLWTRLFLALADAPDIRLRPVLERAVVAPSAGSQFWPMLAQRSLALLRELPERVPELAPAQRELIAQLHERIAQLAAAPPTLVATHADRQAQLEAELLAKIHAEPHVLEHRLVWADALLGRGDARGEFISLQFARPAGQKPSKREKQLLAEHELSWLGELVCVVDRDSVRWANGFPIRADVVFDSQAQRELIDSPMWATFEELECDDLQLIESPSLRSLRRVGRLSLTTLVALAEARGSALGLEQLGPVGLPQNPPAELDRLRAAAAERLANVREIRLHLRDYAASKRPEDFDWLFTTPLGRRLTRFRLSAIVVPHDETSLVPWSQWAAARTRWPGIERLRLDMGVISVEMCDRQLIVRTMTAGDPMPYYDNDARQQLAALRDHFDQLELISCAAKPLSDSTATRWAQTAGFHEFVHTHAPAIEPISGYQASRALGKAEARERKARTRIARAAKQTRTEPPPPRRYGPGPTGPWLACDRATDNLHFRWGSTISFSPDGRELLALGLDFVSLSVPDLKPQWWLRSPNHPFFSSFALDSELQRAWIGTGSGATMLWDLRAGRELARARFHRNRVHAVEIRGERMYSVDLDRKLQLWHHAAEHPSAEPVMLIPERSIGLDTAPIDLALDPARATLALLAPGTVQLRELDDPARRRIVPALPGATTIAWSPRGDHFLVGSHDGLITLADPDGIQLTTIHVHHRRLGGFCWTPDGGRLITVGDDETGPAIRVIDSDTGELVVRIIPSAPGQLARVACSPDGRLLAASAYDWVGCWTLDDGAELGRWRPG